MSEDLPADLKEVDTAYSNAGTDYANPTNFSNYIAVGVFPQTITTTLASNGSPLVSQDTYKYDSFGSYEDYTGITHHFSFGQVLSSSESDFGSTAPLRTTLHSKLWQSNWNYYAKNLIDLPGQDTVLAGSSNGTQVAQTTYKYDEGSPYSYTEALGLLTSVIRWHPITPINPTTHSVYSATSHGMPIQKIDANGNITKLTYDSSGLYLSNMKYPDGSSESPQYDDNTGLLMLHTDVNGQSTHYTYDSMRRLTRVVYPDGGSETLSYVDTVGSLSVNFTKAIAASTSLVKTAFADGLGRLTQTQLTSDPDGAVYTNTKYDSLGRVASVSNPYRFPSDGTSGVTRYTYDALSRKAVVSEPDGNTKQACFNGIRTNGQSNCRASLLGSVSAWEDDADENQNDWQRTQNALGQMTHVFEPSGASNSPSMETDYFYDVLNNLLAVDQWGGSNGSTGERRARIFKYDSLSRLLSSSNPETGMSVFAYDANGNVLNRTDARGVSTAYQYDTMNRLYCKSYSGDISSTPMSLYQYGTSQQTGFVGRVINAWTQGASAGACPTNPPTSAPTAGSFLSLRTISSYDQMGRITSESQYTLANIASGTPYTLAYSYDLAGDLVSSTDGITPTSTANTTLAFTSLFNGAGRLQMLTSNWSDVTHPTALFTTTPSVAQPSYSAFGGLTNATFGNNNALTLNRTYDNRLRITGETDTGGIVGTATSGSTTVTITGSEQSK